MEEHTIMQWLKGCPRPKNLKHLPERLLRSTAAAANENKRCCVVIEFFFRLYVLSKINSIPLLHSENVTKRVGHSFTDLSERASNLQ
mmetsp:Transcript_33821/g.38497  ORF Transcript_33821/g.38497 Transcript_33821/m.38497 type:complete len:87 (-) Transcript_33821:59-319(-)